MHAEIVTTGTELLLGEIADTNSTYIARQLRDVGLNLYFITSAGDNQERIAKVIDTALNRSDVVISTGGLGPTVGDVTREAVAQATGRKLILDERLLASIETFFARRGFTMTENNRRQAQIPQGAIPLENPVGTAPCFIVEDPRGIVISLPGVPREMEYMMVNVIMPYLKQRLGLKQLIKTRKLKAAGIGESAVDALIADLEQSSNPTIGLAAHPGQIDIRIGVKADSEAEAKAMIDEMETRIRERVGEYIYGTDDDKLETAVVELLRKRGLTLAVGEVATGGMISGRLSLSDLDGNVFRGGRVLPASYPGSQVQPDLRHEGDGLAKEICTAVQAAVTLVVINRGPDETYLLAVHDDRRQDKTLRFRGYEGYAQEWIASYALELVRHLCLDLATEPA